MVEHIGDYEQYTTIYQMKREFDEKNALLWKLKKRIDREIILEPFSYLYLLFLKVRFNNILFY